MSGTHGGKPASESGRWIRLALLNAAVSLWLIYDMASATETPRQTVMMLHVILLGCALFALAGALGRVLINSDL